jgi:ABC-type glycerol-3-phosphate transport system substrate-binding protein
MANTLHLFYRMDLFEEYNLQPPTTYDEVIAACEVLKDEPSIDIPFTMNLHAGWAWNMEFFHFIRSFGGEYLNDDNTPAFNGPEGVAAATKMKEVVDGCMGPEGLTYSIDDSEIGMETGGLAFVEIWASRAANMDNPDLSDFVGGIGFAPAPAPKPGGLLGGSAWLDAYAIPTFTDVDPEVAFLVIMEALDFQSQVEGAALGITIRTSVADAGAGARYLPAVSETLARGVGAQPPNAAITLAETALGNYLPLVGSGDMTPEEALNAAAEEYLTEATVQGFVDG